MRTSSIRRASAVLSAVLLTLALAGCGSDGGTATADGDGDGGGGDGTLVVGFSQVGAESGWRTANTQSIQQAAEDAGIDLRFSDAQQRQENQIAAIRTFIQQDVDVISFSPVVESGWDTVLREAEAAGIPVVLADRAVDGDESLYTTFIGSDFVEEGRRAGQWVLEEFADDDGPVTIVQLEGTTGSAPALDREEGFMEVLGDDDKFEIVASQTGDFTRAGGLEVMQAFLQAHDDIDLLYAHNDDMGLGAIQAIEEAGLVPGEDIKIVTVDAVRDGMEALAEGKINFIVECNPMFGDQLMGLIRQVAAGEDVPKRVPVDEATFTQEEAVQALEEGRAY